MRRRAALALVAVAIAACLGAQRGAGLTIPALGEELLSNETTMTRWAHALGHAPIAYRPSLAARVIGHLHQLTEDRRPEVYLALRSRYDAGGRLWLEIRVPRRPNGITGWVRRGALGPLHLVKTKLVVDRRRLRATLRRDGRVIWSSPIGVGAPRTPTPAGRFYIRELLFIGKRNPFYGPWAFGTSAYARLTDWPGGGVVGIHGTNSPELVPGRPSHGCIRVPNAAVTRLARLMPVGTPVLITR